MDLLIEHGNWDDLDQIEQLYNELGDALETGINYPGWKKGIYPIRKDAAKGIENRNLYVARKDGKIAGSIILNHEPENAYDSVEWQYDGDYSSIFVIHTLAVHPAFKKSGIGSRLIDFSERHGLQNNIKSIRLDVFENNLPAIKLYECCGYQYIATVNLDLEIHGLERFKLYEKLLYHEDKYSFQDYYMNTE